MNSKYVILHYVKLCTMLLHENFSLTRNYISVITSAMRILFVDLLYIFPVTSAQIFGCKIMMLRKTLNHAYMVLWCPFFKMTAAKTTQIQ